MQEGMCTIVICLTIGASVAHKYNAENFLTSGLNSASQGVSILGVVYGVIPHQMGYIQRHFLQ